MAPGVSAQNVQLLALDTYAAMVSRSAGLSGDGPRSRVSAREFSGA